jgi:RNA polymerase sigma-70 factor, ECF subfamily
MTEDAATTTEGVRFGGTAMTEDAGSSDAVALPAHATPTLEEAWRLHRRRVYVTCLKIARDHDRAEDLTQEVFLHLATRLHLYRGESKFSTWLTRVAINIVLGSIRKGRNDRRAVSLEAMAEDEAGRAELQKAVAVEDRRLGQTPDRLTALAALDRMPRRYKPMCELCLLGGIGIEEAAEALGISIGGAKAQLSRGRAWLAAECARHGTRDEAVDDALAELERYM